MKLLNLASDKLISRVKFAAVRNNGAGLSGDRYRDGGDGGKGKGLDPPPLSNCKEKLKKYYYVMKGAFPSFKMSRFSGVGFPQPPLNVGGSSAHL